MLRSLVGSEMCIRDRYFLEKLMMALCLETAWEPPRDCRQCSARDGHESARHETLCLLVLTHPLCPFGKVELKCCGPRDDDDKQACFYMNDRIIRIYGRSWNTHARRTRNERSCQSRSRVASCPPFLTGLTGPRINLGGMFLRRSDWVPSTQTPHGSKISISSHRSFLSI